MGDAAGDEIADFEGDAALVDGGGRGGGGQGDGGELHSGGLVRC